MVGWFRAICNVAVPEEANSRLNPASITSPYYAIPPRSSATFTHEARGVGRPRAIRRRSRCGCSAIQVIFCPHWHVKFWGIFVMWHPPQ